jgi:hypothetical protein
MGEDVSLPKPAIRVDSGSRSTAPVSSGRMYLIRPEASDVDSMAIARSSSLDSIDLRRLSYCNPLKTGRFWTPDGRSSVPIGRIFLNFAGVPNSVALFTGMSQAFHGLVSPPTFRLGSRVFETVVAVRFLIPKTARMGAVVCMTAVILSHIFVAFISCRPAGNPMRANRKVWGRRLPYKRTKNGRAKHWEAEPQDPDNSAVSTGSGLAVTASLLVLAEAADRAKAAEAQEG